MYTIVESAVIHAPIDRCFALSTRVELVQKTLGMQLIGGVTSGHIIANSRVHWRGWKFGLPTEHHTLITQFAAPHRDDAGDLVAWFEDSQERGRFATFAHMHHFRERNGITELEDRIHFSLPWFYLGSLGERFLVGPHARHLAQQRFAMIKQLAESDGWRKWLDAPAT